MTDPRLTLTFPAAYHQGGVERIVWEMIRYFAPRRPTSFVGYDVERNGLYAFEHIAVRKPRWARDALAPVGFRRAARTAIGDAGGERLAVSFGVNAPPGDVYVVNSVHRGWLQQGREVRIGGRAVPNTLRYAMPRHRALLALERDYFQRHTPRAIVAVSDVVVEDLARLYGVRNENTHVIHNGYDPAICSPERRAGLRARRRSELGVADDTVVLLFVANELHRKGLGVLLTALAALEDDRAEVHVVGRMPLTDHQHRIDELGLRTRVHYHGSTPDIGLFHAIADVLVLPTQYEAFALTIVEALASGLPVITTAIPGASDLVAHDVVGLVQQDPLDDRELAGLLAAALDAANRDRWSAAAPAAAEGHDWTSLMAVYARVLEGLS